jgi:hypothetical protein
MAMHVVLLLTAVMVCLDDLVGCTHNGHMTQGVGLPDPCCAVLCSPLSLLPSAAYTGGCAQHKHSNSSGSRW